MVRTGGRKNNISRNNGIDWSAKQLIILYIEFVS
jgi:hypothetical protein